MTTQPTVLQRKATTRYPETQHVVLCKVDGYQPYATWIEVDYGEGTFYVNGHYYERLETALLDYQDRS